MTQTKLNKQNLEMMMQTEQKKQTNKFCKHALMTIEEQCMMIGLPKANL
jgi:hypothetical protein